MAFAGVIGGTVARSVLSGTAKPSARVLPSVRIASTLAATVKPGAASRLIAASAAKSIKSTVVILVALGP